MSEKELEDYIRRVNENEDSAVKLIEINKQLLSTIEEQKDEIEHLKERIKDLEQDRDENFKRIPIAEQVGISDKDFY